MSRVKGKDTRPELRLRRLLHAQGYRFRLHRRDLPGSPDLVFPSRRCVVFVHGCFWHRHPGCKLTRTPKSNTEFWKSKFQENVRRDRRNRRKLESMGWHVLIVWECELNDSDQVAQRVSRFLDAA